jgi:hypothetical protein
VRGNVLFDRFEEVFAEEHANKEGDDNRCRNEIPGTLP